MKKKFLLFVMAFALMLPGILLLSACGGGGGITLTLGDLPEGISNASVYTQEKTDEYGNYSSYGLEPNKGNIVNDFDKTASYRLRLAFKGGYRVANQQNTQIRLNVDHIYHSNFELVEDQYSYYLECDLGKLDQNKEFEIVANASTLYKKKYNVAFEVTSEQQALETARYQLTIDGTVYKNDSDSDVLTKSELKDILNDIDSLTGFEWGKSIQLKYWEEELNNKIYVSPNGGQRILEYGYRQLGQFDSQSAGWGKIIFEDGKYKLVYDLEFKEWGRDLYDYGSNKIVKINLDTAETCTTNKIDFTVYLEGSNSYNIVNYSSLNISDINQGNGKYQISGTVSDFGKLLLTDPNMYVYVLADKTPVNQIFNFEEGTNNFTITLDEPFKYNVISYNDQVTGWNPTNGYNFTVGPQSNDSQINILDYLSADKYAKIKIKAQENGTDLDFNYDKFGSTEDKTFEIKSIASWCTVNEWLVSNKVDEINLPISLTAYQCEPSDYGYSGFAVNDQYIVNIKVNDKSFDVCYKDNCWTANGQLPEGIEINKLIINQQNYLNIKINTQAVGSVNEITFNFKPKNLDGISYFGKTFTVGNIIDNYQDYQSWFEANWQNIDWGRTISNSEITIESAQDAYNAIKNHSTSNMLPSGTIFAFSQKTEGGLFGYVNSGEADYTNSAKGELVITMPNNTEVTQNVFDETTKPYGKNESEFTNYFVSAKLTDEDCGDGRISISDTNGDGVIDYAFIEAWFVYDNSGMSRCSSQSCSVYLNGNDGYYADLTIVLKAEITVSENT